MKRLITVLSAFLSPAVALPGGPLEPPEPPAPTASLAEPRGAITALPVTIEAAGSYYLTGDLAISGEATGIIIATSNVTIDLNGFTLRGDPGALIGGGIGGPEAGAELSNIMIRNGIIRDWAGSGIDLLSSASQVHAENLQVTGCGAFGIQLGPDSLVRRCIVRDSGETGISVSLGSVVESCISSDNGVDGIRALAGSVVRGCTSWDNARHGYQAAGAITACTAEANISAGVSAFDGSQISRCSFPNNNLGIFGDNISVTDCNISRSDVGGIDAGQRSSIVDTIVRISSVLSDGDGISLTSDSSVRGCVVLGHVNGIGISAQGGHNQIFGNTLIDNDVMIDLASTFPLGTRGNYVAHNCFGRWRGNKVVVEGPGFSNFVGGFISSLTLLPDHNPSLNFLMDANSVD